MIHENVATKADNEGNNNELVFYSMRWLNLEINLNDGEIEENRFSSP